ncbi:MAG: PIG-L family deacetylase [Erysipelotrichaceae bacterium]
MKAKKVFVLVMLVCSMFFVQDVYASETNIKLNQEELKDVDHLMIVAHPDDETIWGASHLLKDKYLVVCITNGKNNKRHKEFVKVMKKIKTPYLILNYPDKVKGQRDDWKSSEEAIQKDLNYIMNFKDWKLIATHNPKGEYGHIHHKRTSNYVTKIVKDQKLKTKFYYFGEYKQKKHIKELKNVKKISKKDFTMKKKMMKLYKSQAKVDKKLKHMYPYEAWILESEWN